MTIEYSRRSLQMVPLAGAIMIALAAGLSVHAQCCVEGGAVMGEMGGVYSSIPGQIIEGDSIYLTVNVPEKAIVQVNGDPTISQGPTRYFVVRGLEPGRVYSFEIVAETANPAGVAMEEKKLVKLHAGSTEIVSLRPVKRKAVKVPAKDAAKDSDKKESTKGDVSSKDGDAEPVVKTALPARVTVIGLLPAKTLPPSVVR
jgi:uncharacterized protein (TIGR03000 family)